jgi:hypothetical protein
LKILTLRLSGKNQPDPWLKFPTPRLSASAVKIPLLNDVPAARRYEGEYIRIGLENSVIEALLPAGCEANERGFRTIKIPRKGNSKSPSLHSIEYDKRQRIIRKKNFRSVPARKQVCRFASTIQQYGEVDNPVAV